MAKYSVSYIYEIVDKYSAVSDRIKQKTDRLKSSIDRSSQSFVKFGQSMQKAGAIGSAALSLPLLMLGNNMLKAASDAEETRSKFATIFKSMGSEAEGVADGFAKSFGLAGSTSRKLLGDTSDMLTGFGFTAEAALKLSEQTNALAIDLASFTNFSGGAEGASQALTKALLGERESIKSLGIAILEEDVKRKVQQLRSEGIKFATEREAKAYATLQLAISQSKNAIGDYARTKSSFANVQRRVAQRNLELRESFGKIMIPAATKALLLVEELQEKFIGLDDKTKKIIVVIAGLSAVIFPLLLVLGTLAMLVPVIVKGFAVLAGAVALIFGPIGVAVAVIAGLVAAFKFAYKYNERFRNGINSMVEGVKSAFSDLINFISPIFETLFGWFDKITNFIAKFGVGAMQKMGFFADLNFENPAAQSAANQNTLNGSIAVTASGGATVESANFSTNNGNLGATVATQGK